MVAGAAPGVVAHWPLVPGVPTGCILCQSTEYKTVQYGAL
jgi:hypothetical protein